MDFLDELKNLECASQVMRDALRVHPAWVGWLKQRTEDAQQNDPAQDWQDWLAETGRAAERLASLRTFRQRALIEIALRDLAGVASFEETVARLSRLAEWVISAALEAAWDGMAAKMPPPVKAREGFAVIAVGKLGAAELNYSSDVDLIFCRRTCDDDQEAGFLTRLGERLVRVLGHPGPEGFLYRVDMRLRPHGGTGSLVPTIDSLENYYESWGEAWERQALIKARPICGDEELGRRFERFAGNYVFARQMDDSSLEEIKQVKHRSEKEHARPGDKIHIKQGPGGIRDIEFYVQYLQLFSGSTHPEVRAAATLAALRALGAAKVLLEGEESQLSLAYVFLRTVEHRLQLRALTPQAMIPESRHELDLLAHGLGFGSKDHPEIDSFLAALQGYRARARSILERVYLTPGQLRPREREEEFAQLLSERTPKERVRELLSSYGFRDIDKAWQNIRLMALGPAGHLLPPGERRAFLEVVFGMLEVLRDSYDPDQALHHLESFAAASGNRVSFLRALASRRPHLARVANLFALSNLGHQILSRHPEYFDSLARGIHLHEGRGCSEMFTELESRIQTAPVVNPGLVLRKYRQREMIRIAYRDLAELAGPLEVGTELSDLAEACLRSAFNLIPSGSGANAPQLCLWIVALGRLGSRQMHYSSDLDLLFLYEDPPADASPELRQKLQLLQDTRVERFLELLAGVTAEGIAYKVDLRLRPEGASGLLARSWSSFMEHSRRYMQPWERLALVRSRILAEPAEVRRRWDDVLREAVFEFPWDEESVAAIRHLKRRIEVESNKESRICLDFKFGTGGISDLDFLVQLLQVYHGKAHRAVRVPGVEDALPALREVGALSGEEAAFLLAALQFQRRVENHYQLIEEWSSREISRESPVLERLARSLGYRQGSPGEARKAFVADWDHTSLEVRALVDRYFYGIS